MVTWKTLTAAPLGAIVLALGTVSGVQAATFYGEGQTIADGFAQTYVTFDDETNTISELGVTFSAGVLNLSNDPDQSDIKYELSLPEEAKAANTVFDVIDFGYSTYRYEDLDILQAFAVPRFDIDFFRITSEERDQICPNPIPNPLNNGLTLTCVGEELAQAVQAADPDAVPEGFSQIFSGSQDYAVARAGTRYSDPSIFEPIATGEVPFTTAYNYGYFEGEWDFIHTVTTKSFLQEEPIDVVTSLAQPSIYPETGYYPTEYKVTYDPTTQQYRVALQGWVYRRAVPEVSPVLGLLAFGLWGAVSLTKNQLNKQKLAR